MKTPPFAKALVIPEYPLIYLFVGAPYCWECARREQEKGFHHFLCLPSADQVADYHWPVADCYVVVIVFTPLNACSEAQLLAVLSHYQPLEIALRHWPSTDVISRRRKP